MGEVDPTALEIVWQQWQGDGKWLFRSSRGLRLSKAIMNQAFTRIRERAGCPFIRLYDLRHDALFRACLAGVPGVLLRDLGGHRSSARTDHYTRLRPGYLDVAAQAIEIKID